VARILIIDRDIQEAGIEEMALELEDHEVRVEPDGDDALKLVEQGWPDLVILDPNHEVGIPAVNAAREETDVHDRIPLLLVENPHEGPSRGFDELADDRLAHPFDVATLQAKVERLLGD
jgi:DNA-binding response OmpR family regulator